MEIQPAQSTETHPHEDHVSISLAEEHIAAASTTASITSDSASTQLGTAQTWTEWMEDKKKEYGTPNDWVDANPTAKYYQQQANEFFKGIGQWGHEMALHYFPTLYNYSEPSQTRSSSSSSSSASSIQQ